MDSASFRNGRPTGSGAQAIAMRILFAQESHQIILHTNIILNSVGEPEKPGRTQAMSMKDFLRIEHVSKRFGSQPALNDVSLAIRGNEYLSLLGPSGSGKTTLLRVIAGFEAPDSGGMFFEGRSLLGVPAHRRGIGFVFQNFALFPHLDVFENVAFGLVNRSDAPVMPKSEIRRRVDEIIALVGLEGLERRAVTQISGGQRQRVALARTLVTRPRVVLLDEPLGALDANLRTRMRGELRRIQSELGVSFVHVTGSETEALAMGDRMVVLDAGRIGQVDAPGVIYTRPATPGVARYLNCYQLFDGRFAEDGFTSAVGRFNLPGTRLKGESAVYAVRRDQIDVRPGASTAGDGESGVEGVFLASEYCGPAVTYLFRLADGHIVEVDHHLSHHPPQEFVASERYRLVWRDVAALAFN
jgi:ABC-type Fe3+/spermidine/putrescine transport system ATPase subunit